VENLNNDEKYIHNDYFLVEISDNNLPESTVVSPMLNQLPGKLTFVDPYVIPTVVPPEPVIGTWGEWTEKTVGTCDNGKQSYDLTRACNDTPKGKKKVTEICGDLKKKFDEGRKTGRVYFNDIQCGHGPANEAADEKVCPGIPNGNRYSGARCKEKGSIWNLDKLYN